MNTKNRVDIIVQDDNPCKNLLDHLGELQTAFPELDFAVRMGQSRTGGWPCVEFYVTGVGRTKDGNGNALDGQLKALLVSADYLDVSRFLTLCNDLARNVSCARVTA